MQDILVVGLVILAGAAAGLPFAMALPAGRFEMRWALAPPLGFGLLAAATGVSYVRMDVAPWMVLATLPLSGLGAGALLATISRQRLALPPLLPAAAIAVIGLVLLAPAWTGGPRFRVFQANVYDHMLYVGSAMAYRLVDYATLVTADPRQADPIYRSAIWFIDWRGAISMVLAGVSSATRTSVVAGAYPYMVALQLNMLFAALFVFRNVLGLARWPLATCAAALAGGFFEQYVVDINAMSQLAGQPLHLLLFGCVALAFDQDRFGIGPAGIARMAVLFGALIGGIFFLYPEPVTIYGPASAVACIAAGVVRASRRQVPTAAAGLAGGLGLGILMCIPLWSGTGAYVVRVLTQAAGETPDWWKYFQRYLFGRAEIYPEIIIHQTGSLAHVLYAWFSFPLEAVVAALGLFYVLPSASWPVPLALLWKLVLYVCLIVLAKAVIAALSQMWRTQPESAASRFLTGCIAGCLMPLGILATGHGWAAGKGLSMAAPLLFALLIAPLVARLRDPKVRLASWCVVLFHLGLGLARPLLVPAGTLPGLPTAAAQVAGQKARLDWDYSRLSSDIGACKGVVIDIENPMMNVLLRRLAFEAGVPWAAPQTRQWPKTENDHFPANWERFDCIASTDRAAAASGRRLIDLSGDHSLWEFLDGRRPALEIGVLDVTGLSTTGLYGVEATPAGALQWAAPRATIDLPNRPQAIRKLTLQLWPMPIAGSAFELRINGRVVFSGVPPQTPLAVSLDAFMADETLKLEFATNQATRFPGDPRELGFALKEIRLER